MGRSKYLVDYLVGFNDWRVGEHVARSKKAAVGVWVANAPVFDTNTYEPIRNLIHPWNLWQKYRLRKHIMNCAVTQIITRRE